MRLLSALAHKVRQRLRQVNYRHGEMKAEKAGRKAGIWIQGIACACVVKHSWTGEEEGYGVI
jgi:hypothetical protein